MPRALSGKEGFFDAALERHLRWQHELLRDMTAARAPRGSKRRFSLLGDKSPRFLVLRPGDKQTVCEKHGMGDVRAHCRKLQVPRGPRRAGVHWDNVMLAGNTHMTRPIPGLGNVALSLVAAAATAVVSRRVLLLENFSIAGSSFGAPMHELLVETSGWAPFLAAATEGSSGSAVDGFAAHDDIAAFDVLCGGDLRRVPEARVWRIFSNQYFLPLLMLNPHHWRQVEAMAKPAEGHDGLSLWTPGLRALWTPAPRLATLLDSFAGTAGLRGAPYVAMHVRTALTGQRDSSRRLAAAVACARRRLAANNASRLFLATMFASNRRALSTELRSFGVSVHWYGRAIEAQGESSSATDSALVDMLLMGGASEVLVTPGSTFGYVVQGLAGRRATVYGGTHTSRDLVGPAAADCSRVPTSEPNFHFLQHALRSFASCRAGRSSALSRASETYARSAQKH